MDQGLVSVSNFLITVIVARLLGPQDFGRFALAYSLVLLCSAIHRGVLVSPMMVLGQSAEDASARDRYFTSMVTIQIAFTGAIVGVAYGMTKLVDRAFGAWSLGDLAGAIAALAAMFVAQDFFRRIHFARERTGSAVVLDLVTNVARLGAVAALMLQGDRVSVNQVLWWLAGASALSSGVGVAQLRRDGLLKLPSAGVLRSVCRRNWVSGRWLLATQVVVWTKSRTAPFIVAELVSPVATGGLQATMNLAGAANVLNLAIENFVPARAARHYRTQGVAGLNRYLLRIGVLGGCAIASLMLLLVVLREPLVELVYGARYTDYAWVMAWWGLYMVLAFLHLPLTVGIRVGERTGGILRANLVGAMLVVGLCLLLTAPLGLLGAMTAYCAGQAVILCMLAWAYHHRFAEVAPASGSEQHAQVRTSGIRSERRMILPE